MDRMELVLATMYVVASAHLICCGVPPCEASRDAAKNAQVAEVLPVGAATSNWPKKATALHAR
jgi:hypothetical protein